MVHSFTDNTSGLDQNKAKQLLVTLCKICNCPLKDGTCPTCGQQQQFATGEGGLEPVYAIASHANIPADKGAATCPHCGLENGVNWMRFKNGLAYVCRDCGRDPLTHRVTARSARQMPSPAASTGSSTGLVMPSSFAAYTAAEPAGDLQDAKYAVNRLDAPSFEKLLLHMHSLVAESHDQSGDQAHKDTADHLLNAHKAFKGRSGN